MEAEKPQAESDDSNTDLRDVRLRLNPVTNQPIRGEVEISWRMPNSPRTGSQILPAKETIDLKLPSGADIGFSSGKLVGSIAPRRQLGRVPSGAGVHEIRVDLNPAGLVRGQVVDAGGAPVPKYRIDIDRWDNVNRWEDMPQHSEIQNIQVDQPSGKFSLGPLPMGKQHRYRAFVQVSDDWRLAFSETFQITESNPIAAVTITMSPVVRISGRVTNSSGEPVAGTPVRMTWRDASAPRSLGPAIQTDRDGRFEATISSGSSGAIEGLYWLSIPPCHGLAGRTIDLWATEVSEDQDFGTLALKPGSVIRGYIRDKNGHPCRNVNLSLFPEDRLAALYHWSRNASTAEDGSFEIDGVEPVRQLLLVYGRTVSRVTRPAEPTTDPIGHSQWVIDPGESEFELIITVE